VALSRDWYETAVGLKVEFAVPALNAIALQDDAGFTLFIEERAASDFAPSCILTFQVDDVEAKSRLLEKEGIELKAAPQKLRWGYGAELVDPDGYIVRLWDPKSMSEQG
jgi:predicted enzyme related to lactoylglutathione lyase